MTPPPLALSDAARLHDELVVSIAIAKVEGPIVIRPLGSGSRNQSCRRYGHTPESGTTH